MSAPLPTHSIGCDLQVNHWDLHWDSSCMRLVWDENQDAMLVDIGTTTLHDPRCYLVRNNTSFHGDCNCGWEANRRNPSAPSGNRKDERNLK